MSQPPPVRGFQSFSELPLQPAINVPSVVSLVLGLLSFCLPVIAGLPAVAFGTIGLKRSRNSNTGGRGPAIAGIVLGAVSTVLALAIAVPVTTTWMNSRPQKVMAKQFIEAVSRRDIQAAASVSAYTLGWDQIGRLGDRLNSLGELREVKFTGYVHKFVNNLEEWELTGDAICTKDFTHFTLTTVRQDGQWKVYRLQLPRKVKAGQPNNNVPPATQAQPW